jgi:hypothetical protein
VYEYSANVLRYCGFQGSPSKQLYLGAELEVEVKDGAYSTHVQQVYTALGEYGILKRDGSIGYGFEIVTAPCSLEVHQEVWPAMIPAISKGLASWNTSTCGMHVHVSRAPLDAYTIGKLQVFINAPVNRAAIVAIAGRSETRWAKFTEKTLENGAQYNNDRYEAINLQNKNTIEFRIFKGTLDLAHILANLEFCDAVCHWALDVPAEQCEMWDVFRAYVRAHAERYTHFIAYIARKGY